MKVRGVEKHILAPANELLPRVKKEDRKRERKGTGGRK